MSDIDDTIKRNDPGQPVSGIPSGRFEKTITVTLTQLELSAARRWATGANVVGDITLGKQLMRKVVAAADQVPAVEVKEQ